MSADLAQVELSKLKLEADSHKRQKMVGNILAKGKGLAQLSELTEAINKKEQTEYISFPVVFVTFERVSSFEMATNGVDASDTPCKIAPICSR